MDNIMEMMERNQVHINSVFCEDCGLALDFDYSVCLFCGRSFCPF